MGVPRLLEAMWGASDFYFDTVSQVHMDGWSSGRVVLVGDASYCPSPMAGVGTSLALVGAYVLAGELATASGDHRRAFVRYEEEMLDYVKQGQKLAKGNATGLIPGSRLQIRLRNQIIRMLPSDDRFQQGGYSEGVLRAAGERLRRGEGASSVR
jgi:2-polyprenyl-6-methoxyphenol hydroxylase-like FAD-dependent oxidoreductase